MFVANRVPYPPYRGDKLKIWNLAKRLCKEHELHLFTIAQSKEELQQAEILKTVFKEVHIIFLPKWKSLFKVALAVFSKIPFQVAYFRSSSFLKLLQDHLQKHAYDAIHIQHLRMGWYFQKLNRQNAVLDLPDAFSLYWQRRVEMAKWPWVKIFTRIEQRRLLQMEKNILPTFPLTLVCSEEDKQYLLSHAQANIQILPNGVDTDTYYPRTDLKPEPFRILFTGNMDYAPNIDAVAYFCHELLPKIKETHPAVVFVIAGQRPVKRVLDLACEYVQVTGFVKNLTEEYARAAVVVAPLRFGAGTQNKVLEALAMGIPVVCTRVGFKGLGLNNGEGIIMADTSDTFANAVIDLLESEANRSRISGQGLQKVVATFGWDAVSTKLIQYLKSVEHKL